MGRRYKLLKRGNRPHLVVRWHDGQRWRERSTGTSRRREAERAARDLIEAASAAAAPAGDWHDFRQSYAADHLTDLSADYRATTLSAARKLEELCNPQHVRDVTPRMLTDFRTKMREEGLKASTIESYLKHLRAALNWAHRHGYLREPVSVELPRVPGGEQMKGRPITGEEFDRYLLAARKVLGEHAPPVEFMLRGYWLSGLRLAEGVRLSWDNPLELLVVNIDGRLPLVEIPPSLDKARRGGALPLTPDFVEQLRSVPAIHRVGRVFRPLGKRGRPLRSVDSIGELLRDIGKESGVVVAEGKTPTPHDLRRSFGVRWSSRVMPPVLKELMRHRDIKTTLKYYVGANAERTASEVWAAFERPMQPLGDVLGDIADPAKNRSMP